MKITPSILIAAVLASFNLDAQAAETAYQRIVSLHFAGPIAPYSPGPETRGPERFLCFSRHQQNVPIVMEVAEAFPILRGLHAESARLEALVAGLELPSRVMEVAGFNGRVLAATTAASVRDRLLGDRSRATVSLTLARHRPSELALATVYREFAEIAEDLCRPEHGLEYACIEARDQF